MKSIFTLVSISLFILTLAPASKAQITIDANDYADLTNYRTTYVWVENDSSYTTPTEEDDQLWDYRGLQPGLLADFDYLTTTDPFFSDSYHYEAGGVALSAFIVPTDHHMGLDSEGYYRYGQEQHDTTFSIAAVTGGSMDEIHFIDHKEYYNGYMNEVFFPMTYEDWWIDTVSRTTQFELTVAGLGLNNVPGYHQRTFILDNEIVGYGKLVMDDSTGVEGDTMDVILRKTWFLAVDSFFVGGSPAPASLLAGLGTAQGSTVEKVLYSFYRKGYGDLVMELESSDDTPGSALVAARFNRNAVPEAPQDTTTVGISELENSAISLFPNPVQPGRRLIIETAPNAPATSSFQLTGIDGRVIHQFSNIIYSNSALQVTIPNDLPTGIYTIQSFANNGQIITSNKLLVTE